MMGSPTRNCRRCEACRLAFNSQVHPSNLSQMMFSSSSDSKPEMQRRKPRTRPSSVESCKSSPDGAVRGPSGRSRASSDSKISTVTSNSARKRLSKHASRTSKLDQESVQVLREDLSTIKEQLYSLTKQRNETLGATNQLQVRYINLKRKSEDQEKEIEDLRYQNESLQKKATKPCRPIPEETEEATQVREVKKNLDIYERKLKALFEEIMAHSKVMVESRERLCRGQVQQKSVQCSQDMTALREKDAKYQVLVEKYNRLKDNEMRFTERNKELEKSVSMLEEKLNVAMNNMITIKNGHLSQRQQQNGEDDFPSFDHFNNQTEDEPTSSYDYSQNMQAKYHVLRRQYDILINKLNQSEDSERQRLRELQALRDNEKNLVVELVKLKNLSNDLQGLINKNEVAMSQLASTSKRKDAIIHSQKQELATRSKQLAIATENEEELRKTVNRLEAQLQTMKYAQQVEKRVSNNKELAAKPGEECCCLNITGELENLIDTLYEEADKTSVKDVEIRKLEETIQSLHAALRIKENDLIVLRRDLQCCREQLNRTLLEKEAVVENLKMLEQQQFQNFQLSNRNPSSQYDLDCYCDE